MTSATAGHAPEWIVLARLLRPQGRKGEVLAELYSDFPESLPGRAGLYLAPENFSGPAAAARLVEVLTAWQPTGRNEGRVVLHIAGCDDINAAEKLQRLELITAAEDRLPLEEGEAYVSDLVGCTVYDQETRVGEIVDVQFPLDAEGSRMDDSAPLLVVHDDAGDEILIPFVNDFLVEQNLPARKVTMKLPEGLLDLNRKP